MKDTEELLQELHEEVAKKLLEKIESGKAKAADFAQAIVFLKNNGIDCESVKDSPLDKLNDHLGKVLPFTTSDSIHENH